MSVKEQMGYALECDFPGCDVKTQDLGDYAFWSDLSHAIDEWVDSDGFYDDKLGAYCHHHVEWDEEADERVPMQDTIETRIRFANQRILRHIERLERQALRRLDQLCVDMEESADQRWWDRAAPLLPRHMTSIMAVPF